MHLECWTLRNNTYDKDKFAAEQEKIVKRLKVALKKSTSVVEELRSRLRQKEIENKKLACDLNEFEIKYLSQASNTRILRNSLQKRRVEENQLSTSMQSLQEKLSQYELERYFRRYLEFQPITVHIHDTLSKICS